jgi:hypothetical protein
MKTKTENRWINMEDAIKKIIGSTWFSFEDVESESASLTSREYGSTGEETPGVEDIREANRITRELRAAGFTVTADVVDEWVIVTIKTKVVK